VGAPSSSWGRPRHPSPGGAAIFRVSHRGEGIDDADTIEGAREIAQGQPPGRYDAEFLSGDRLQVKQDESSVRFRTWTSWLSSSAMQAKPGPHSPGRSCRKSRAVMYGEDSPSPPVVIVRQTKLQ